jgi:hypothetical protein
LGPPLSPSKFGDRSTMLHYSPVALEEQDDGIFFHVFGTVTEFHFPYKSWFDTAAGVMAPVEPHDAAFPVDGMPNPGAAATATDDWAFYTTADVIDKKI